MSRRPSSTNSFAESGGFDDAPSGGTDSGSSSGGGRDRDDDDDPSTGASSGIGGSIPGAPSGSSGGSGGTSSRDRDDDNDRVSGGTSGGGRGPRFDDDPTPAPAPEPEPQTRTERTTVDVGSITRDRGGAVTESLDGDGYAASGATLDPALAGGQSRGQEIAESIDRQTVTDVTSRDVTIDAGVGRLRDAAVEAERDAREQQRASSGERFGDLDFSAGFGDPEVDEVEQAVDSLPERAEGAVRPASEELFARAGRTGGANALDALGFDAAAEQYDDSVRTFGREILPQTAAGVSEVPGLALEATEFAATRENADELPGAAASAAREQIAFAQQEPATFAAGAVGGAAVGAGAGRFLGTTRVGQGRSGAVLRTVDVDPASSARRGVERVQAAVDRRRGSGLDEIDSGSDVSAPTTDVSVADEIRGRVSNTRRSIQRSRDTDVDADPVATGRSDVGTGGVGSVFEGVDVDAARGISGPSLGSRARNTAQRTAADVTERVSDAVDPFVPTRGED